MAVFDKNKVAVFQSKFRDLNSLVQLKGVLFELDDADRNLTEFGSQTDDKPLLIGNNLYKLHFDVQSYIFIDLNNAAQLLDYNSGEIDAKIGLQLTYLTLRSGKFRIPHNNGVQVSPEFNFEDLKFFLAGLTPEKITEALTLAGRGNEIGSIVNKFSQFKNQGFNVLQTETGSKVAFMSDNDFKFFNAIAHPPTKP